MMAVSSAEEHVKSRAYLYASPRLLYELLSPGRLSVWCVFRSIGKARWLGETSWSIHNYREPQRTAHKHTHTHAETCAQASGSIHAYQLTYTPGRQVTSIHTHWPDKDQWVETNQSHSVTSCIPKQHGLHTPSTSHRTHTVSTLERRVSYTPRRTSWRVNHGLISIFGWTVPLTLERVRAVCVCCTDPYPELQIGDWDRPYMVKTCGWITKQMSKFPSMH